MGKLGVARSCCLANAQSRAEPAVPIWWSWAPLPLCRFLPPLIPRPSCHGATASTPPPQALLLRPPALRCLIDPSPSSCYQPFSYSFSSSAPPAQRPKSRGAPSVASSQSLLGRGLSLLAPLPSPAAKDSKKSRSDDDDCAGGGRRVRSRISGPGGPVLGSASQQ